MQLTREDFTSNDVIDNIQVGDPTVDLVGYVTKVNNNFHSSAKAKFAKFVINNSYGKEVQVIAWNHNTDLLHQIKEVGTIVYIGLAKDSAIKNEIYNNGNVAFELLIKENSTIEICGTYTNSAEDNIPEEVSITEAYGKVGKTIRIEGIIKNEFRIYINQDYQYTVGAITDCSHKLELKAQFDCSTLNLKKGDSVSVMGVVETYPPGPNVLRINSINDIKKIENERIEFADVYQGFRNNIISS